MNEEELRRALGADSGATFEDLRRRLASDRPGDCQKFEAGLAALATGAPDPDAERHAAGCAACRDRLDAARDVWARLEWPRSEARFEDLKVRLRAPLPFRVGRAVAAAILAASAVLLFSGPSEPPETGGAELGRRLRRDGLSPDRIAHLGNERAARTLAAIGGPDADAALLGMMGRKPEIDAIASAALAPSAGGPLHPADLVRRWRPDLLPALIDAAPPGSAAVIVTALFDPRLAAAAARALERLPRAEAESVLQLAGLSASVEEAGIFAERGIAASGALKAVLQSPDYRTRCFWRAVAGEDGVEFLLAAAGTADLREDAFRFLDLLPEDLVAETCRTALRDPALAAGAARAAARLRDLSLVPALREASRRPGAAGLELEEGELVSAKTETLESVCLAAIEKIKAQ